MNVGLRSLAGETVQKYFQNSSNSLEHFPHINVYTRSLHMKIFSLKKLLFSKFCLVLNFCTITILTPWKRSKSNFILYLTCFQRVSKICFTPCRVGEWIMMTWFQKPSSHDIPNFQGWVNCLVPEAHQKENANGTKHEWRWNKFRLCEKLVKYLSENCRSAGMGGLSEHKMSTL